MCYEPQGVVSVVTVKGGETLKKHMTVLFSVEFSAHHRPNMKSNCFSLNTLRAGNSFEAKGCLLSYSVIPNFFPDS